MKFTATRLQGAFVIEPERQEDERGFFARIYCRRELGEHGVSFEIVQSSVSFNSKRGTLRGMHFQAAPHAEAKLVRCTMGAIYDVIVDLRPGSATFRRWAAAELSAQNRKTVLVPEGCAHGFLTLTEDTEVLYEMSQYYRPESARGVRWDDPAFAIDWPQPVRVIAPRDLHYPSFED